MLIPKFTEISLIYFRLIEVKFSLGLTKYHALKIYSLLRS
jgi:hypothetical protein